MFDSVLIANRGEIARRVIRTCRRLGIRSIAVHSDVDSNARHVHEADDAVLIGHGPPASSYLLADRILEAAATQGADAIHPGYGFLSENASFARACHDAGIAFVGPSIEAIEVMGDKAAAKARLKGTGVPVLGGTEISGLSDEAILAACELVGFPLLLKAVAGGGGKGMRVVPSAGLLSESMVAARREAAAAFGDDRMLIERLVSRPRHIEVQVFGDTHRNLVHLFERECSIQRRHQKVIEEAPSPLVDEALRERMTTAALTVASTVDYVGAGTVEFLVDSHGSSADEPAFYFLEMNTRLQVEHPVTEMITGLDLVEWQLRVAAGERLPMTQDEIVLNGHAIEARVYAEDPANGFLPQTGTLAVATYPDAVGTRVDAAVASGDEVSRFYDPLIAKVCAHAEDRDASIHRLRDALGDTCLLGVPTNTAHLAAIIEHPSFTKADLDTEFLTTHDLILKNAPETLELAVAAVTMLEHERRSSPGRSPLAQLGPWRGRGLSRWATRLVVDGADVPALVTPDPAGWLVSIGQAEVRLTPADVDRFVSHVAGESVWLHGHGRTVLVDVLAATHRRDASALTSQTTFTSPMPGAVIDVHVKAGDTVAIGQVMAVVEAMKMEHPVTATAAGVVVAVHVEPGQAVDADQPLVEFDPEPEPALD